MHPNFHLTRNLKLTGGYHGQEVEEEVQEVIRVSELFLSEHLTQPR